MGTRLYPHTTDRSALETLACVPAGTYDRLTALEARQQAELEVAKPEARYDLGYRHYCERNDDAMGTLDAFLTFGWGKFRPVDDIGHDYAGHETDLTRAATLLASNGINVDVALTGGLRWS
jgi:hypothetical protein